MRVYVGGELVGVWAPQPSLNRLGANTVNIVDIDSLDIRLHVESYSDGTIFRALARTRGARLVKVEKINGNDVHLRFVGPTCACGRTGLVFENERDYCKSCFEKRMAEMTVVD